ncbi:MAG: hypothetical protein J6Y93_02550, partial [Treponema sp.]|nr:hypothetical protein [Treponema sp.]
TQWYDSQAMPAILENYRLLHTCVKNLFESLSKKSLITPDPYKKEKKISDIKSPESTPFTDQERSLVMGMRMSDYESTLDFLCNYYKFSVSNITIGSIKKLVDLNNWIQWTSFTPNSPRIITRSLANMVQTLRTSADTLNTSLLNDSISKASRAMGEINAALKEYTDFQKELYKGNIRKHVFESPNFSMEKAMASATDEMANIKKCFASAMGKTPFYNDLVEDIIQEDHAQDKEQLQQKVLAKLDIKKEETSQKETKVDTKDMLMGAVRVLGAMTPQLIQTFNKIRENHDLLESEHNSFMDKLKKALKKAFNLPEKPTVYTVTIVEQSTDTRRTEKVNYQNFIADIASRSRRYQSVTAKGHPGYDKIYSMEETKILDFVNKQIQETQRLITILNALDEYFKSAALPQNKPKVKGIKMEITALKNCLVKSNQHRAEYSAYIEEEQQMKKLGIKL